VSVKQRNTDVNAMKIVCVHNGSLKELDLREMSFKQTFQLQVWLFSTAQSTHRT